MADEVAEVSDDIESGESDLDFLRRSSPDSEEETPLEEPEQEQEEEKTEENKPEEEEEKPPLEAKDLVEQIKKESPELLKKIPQLRGAIFRDAQYSSVFSSPDEAKEVAQNYEAFYRLSQDITSGKSATLLNAVADTSPEALGQFVKGFLPAVLNKSKDLYYEITEPIFRNALRYVEKEGSRRGDKNLVLAVKHIANLIYDNPDLPKEERTRPDPEKENLRKQLEERDRGDFNNFATTTQDEVHDYLARQVLDTTRDINATNSQRLAYIELVLEELGETLEADREHMGRMSSLQNRARSERFSTASKNALQQTYINRAKLHLPRIMSKLRQEFFGTSKLITKTVKPQIPTGGGPGTARPGRSEDRKLANKMSDRDFLNRHNK